MPGRIRVLLAAVVLAWLAAPRAAVAADDLRAWIPVAAPTLGAQAFGAPRIARPALQGYRIDGAVYRPRGPSQVREEWMLAQPRLTLPPTSPDPMPRGQWELSVYVNRGTDFGWKQQGPAEMPTQRDYLIDGEHQTTALSARYGLSRRLSVGLRLPVQWRGGGFLDDWVDQVHRWGRLFGSDDNDRPQFLHDAYRVEGRDRQGQAVSWSDSRGWGLGNVELSGQVNVWRPRSRSDWRAGAVLRVMLPTGTGPFAVGGLDGGLQFLVARQVQRRLDLYAGVGGTVVGDTLVRGLRYRRLRLQGFASLEYHVSTSWSWILTMDASSGLVANLSAYPNTRWVFHLSARGDVATGVEVEIGLTENLTDQQATVDFGAFLAVHVRF